MGESVLSSELQDLLPHLADDSTGIRKVFLIDELRGRVSLSPLAAVGIMDLVESIAPRSDSACEAKNRLILEALNEVDAHGNTSEVLRCLRLMNERLAYAAYERVSDAVRLNIRSIVAERTAREPETALAASSAVFDGESTAISSPFCAGILDGLLALGQFDPTKLLLLRRFREIAPMIIAGEPRLAEVYLSAASESSAATAAIDDLIVWIGSQQDSHVLSVLRRMLIPSLRSNDDSGIAAELLKDIPANEVTVVLELLYLCTEGFKLTAIRQVVERHIARRYPTEVRLWARHYPWMSDESGLLVAATYTQTRDGLEELLQERGMEDNRRSRIVAAFLRQIGAQGFPIWFREVARQRGAILSQLLSYEAMSSPLVVAETTRLLTEVREIMVGTSDELAQRIECFSRQPFFHDLVDCAMRSAIGCFISGAIDVDRYERWQRESWANEWLGRASSAELQPVLTRSAREGADTWERAWRWLAQLPPCVFAKTPSILRGLLERLLSLRHWDWQDTTANLWLEVLGRARGESGFRTYRDLCTHALKYALAYPESPLSRLVAWTFPVVYDAVINGEDVGFDVGGRFSFFDWDKGKQLRRELVDTYYRSKWPAGDLAIAAARAGLLRKVFKRVRQKLHGADYIELMARDLSERSEPEVIAIHGELLSLLHDPDFYESWD
jgi:hypothetical protein